MVVLVMRVNSNAVINHYEIGMEVKTWVVNHRELLTTLLLPVCWGLSAGYQPRPQVVDRGTTARYGGQL